MSLQAVGDQRIELCKIYQNFKERSGSEASALWVRVQAEMQRALEAQNLQGDPSEYFIQHASSDLRQLLTGPSGEICDKCAEVAADFFLKNLPREVEVIEVKLNSCEESELREVASQKLLKHLAMIKLSKKEFDGAEKEALKLQKDSGKFSVFRKIYSVMLRDEACLESAISRAESSLQNDKVALSGALTSIISKFLLTNQHEYAAIFMQGVLPQYQDNNYLTTIVRRYLLADDLETAEYFANMTGPASRLELLTQIAFSYQLGENSLKVIQLLEPYLEQNGDLNLNELGVRLLKGAYLAQNDIKALTQLCEKTSDMKLKFEIQIACSQIYLKCHRYDEACQMAISASGLDVNILDRIRELRGLLVLLAIRNEFTRCTSLYLRIEILMLLDSFSEAETDSSFLEEYIALYRGYLFFSGGLLQIQKIDQALEVAINISYMRDKINLLAQNLPGGLEEEAMTFYVQLWNTLQSQELKDKKDKFSRFISEDLLGAIKKKAAEQNQELSIEDLFPRLQIQSPS